MPSSIISHGSNGCDVSEDNFPVDTRGRDEGKSFGGCRDFKRKRGRANDFKKCSIFLMENEEGV